MPSAHRFSRADSLFAETVEGAQPTRAMIAGKHIEGNKAAVLLARPALGECEQGAADSSAVAAADTAEITDMAVGRAGQHVGNRLQVNETDTLAGIVFGHEHVRIGGLLGQMPPQITADAAGGLAEAAPRRQLEIDKALGPGLG